jgi:hypothetical protein
VTPHQTNTALNERLESSKFGQVSKMVANGLLAASHMGDSLKVHAERAAG